MHGTHGNSSPARETPQIVVVDDIARTLTDQLVASVDDTRRLLGRISERQVYRLMDAGELEFVYVGKRRMVLVQSAKDYIERLRSACRESDRQRAA